MCHSLALWSLSSVLCLSCGARPALCALIALLVSHAAKQLVHDISTSICNGMHEQGHPIPPPNLPTPTGPRRPIVHAAVKRPPAQSTSLHSGDRAEAAKPCVGGSLTSWEPPSHTHPTVPAPAPRAARRDT
mmetsp:Transcript_3248/g.7067  ORF Transcript_3248/g.7067 Transcript_3248/m.7067 type:complete len:131 (+) Transcript_3248:131-523(+)